MDKRGNRLFVALGSIAAIGVLLAAFLVVWLMPRGPETGQASTTNPGSVAPAPAGGSISSSNQGSVNKTDYSTAGGPSMAPNYAAVTDQAHITVRGTGNVSAKPDMATIQVGVQVQNTSLATAQTDAASKMDAVMNQLKSAGIDQKDISTSQYSVEPVMNYRDNQPPEVTGYRVTNIVSVKVRDLTKAGTLIDSLVSSGANSLYGISFGFSDPSALMKQAREQAMKDAKDKAQQLASLGGVGLGAPIAIEDGGSNVPVPPVPMAADAGMAAGQSKVANTAITPGEQQVTVDLAVTYAIK
jgi:uncharacterized protein